MATFYAGQVRVEIEEDGAGQNGRARYKGRVSLPDGRAWEFSDLQSHRGDMGAAEDALGFATAYTSDNRGDDVDPSYPSAELADAIEAAAMDAHAPDRSDIPPGIEEGESEPSTGGRLYFTGGEGYVIADSPKTFARYVARCNALYYRRESERVRAEIKAREAAGESISATSLGSPWGKVVELNRKENEARAAAGLKPRCEAFAWPGGYPILYVDRHSDTLCADCATNHMDAGEEVTAGVHYEGAPETCEDCGEEIESAYGDPEDPELDNR